MTRILIAGSQNWTNEPVVGRALLNLWLELDRPARPVLVSCGNAGADAMANAVGAVQGFTIEHHDDKAQMVAAGADVCLAFIFNDDPDACETADLASASGIRVVRYQITYSFTGPTIDPPIDPEEAHRG